MDAIPSTGCAKQYFRRYSLIKVNKGATLVELLGLLSIIVVMFFLLFPPQRRPSEDTGPKVDPTQSTCLSNLGQIGRAILRYAQDYDDTFPTTNEESWDPEGVGTDKPRGYFGPLKAYVKDTSMLHCPAHKAGGVSYAVNGSRTKKYDGYEGVWGLHGWWGKKLWYSYPAKKSQVLSPANVILAFDIASPHVCSMGTELGDVNSGWYGGFFGQFDIKGKPIKPLHNDGMNFLFCDGHVDWISVVGHPGWNAPSGYIHPPKPREDVDCLAGGRRPSIDIYMADWPDKKISFRRDYKP